MKTKTAHTLIILSLMFMLFPQSFGVYAKPSAFEEEGITYLQSQLSIAESKDCNTDTDKKTPCRVEVFSSSTSVEKTLTGTTQTLTCGVNIYTKVGLLVAKLSESVTVNWGPSGHPFSGATRSTWAASSYGWTALTGPNYVPPASNYTGTTTIDSYGIVTWLGGAPYGAHHVYMHVSGTQSTANWDCNGTY